MAFPAIIELRFLLGFLAFSRAKKTSPPRLLKKLSAGQVTFSSVVISVVEVLLMFTLPLNTNDGKVLLSLIDDSFIGYIPVFRKADLKFWGLSAVS